MTNRKIRIYLVTVLVLVILLGLIIYIYVLGREHPVMEGTMVQSDIILSTIKA